MKNFEEGETVFVIASSYSEEPSLRVKFMVVCIITEKWFNGNYAVKMLTPERYGVTHTDNDFVLDPNVIFSNKNSAAQQFYTNPGVEFEVIKHGAPWPRSLQRLFPPVQIKSLNFSENKKRYEALFPPRKRYRTFIE